MAFSPTYYDIVNVNYVLYGSVLGLLLFIYAQWFGPENELVAYVDHATPFALIPNPECKPVVANYLNRDLSKMRA